MIISSEEEGDTSNIMRDFKKFTSKEIIKELKYDNQESRKEWMLNHFAFAAKNDKKIKDYKFWQDGIDAQGIYLESYYFTSNGINNRHFMFAFLTFPVIISP